jgi:dTDP-4-dehydrorhamnose reductase
MKLWVLGGNGFLGTELQRVCAERGITYVASGHAEADITSLDQLKQEVERIQPTHIVNCAAYTNVDLAEKETQLAFAINGKGPGNLGKIARHYPVKVVHLSTDYVFDGKGNTPYQESDPCNPLSVYGASKYEGELSLQDECPAACILRVSWLFGKQGKNFISSILSVMQQKEEIKVVSDQRGRPTCCADAAEAILDVLDLSGVIHFANQGAPSRFEAAQEVRKIAIELGIPVICKSIIPVSSAEFPTPAKRPAYSVLSTTKFEKICGRVPRDWRAALKERYA